MITVKEKVLEVYRHEVKFFINRQDALLIRQRLKPLMRTDPYGNENGEYWIRSLYFDTQGNKDYLEKISGASQRKKLRIRIYDTKDSSAKLELKNKNESYVHKESLTLLKSDVNMILKGEYGTLRKYQTKTAHKLYAYMQRQRLRPILLIDYEREALTYPFDNIRITIDKNVRASLSPLMLYNPDVATVPVLGDGRYILEVKFQTMLPGFIRAVLSTIGSEHTSISKYCLSRQAISI